MTAPEEGSANTEQIRFWNEQAGPRWVTHQEPLDLMLGPLGMRTMDQAAITPGERVLDVGCGCGHTTIDLARRVGSTGTVVGVDVSAVMLARARERARAIGAANVRFEEADAQTSRLADAAFDVLFSRFGVMFFADPEAAFRNLEGALRPGGRIAFIAWRSLAENPWVMVPLAAALQHVPPPPMPAPDAPGPFAFADGERVRGLLTRAGFDDVRLEKVDEELTAGGADLDQTVAFFFQLGPVAAVLREATPDVVARVAPSVREALAPFHTPDGVKLPSAAWLVTGRRA